MNCRPNQRAWICVPPTDANRRLGLDTLNGHVVETKHVHPDSPASDPCWIVEPRQFVTARGPFPAGFNMRPGEAWDTVSIPDEFLRPFRDFPPEELQHTEATQPGEVTA